MALQNQRRFSIRVAGIDFGVWDTNSGAEKDSAEKKYYPGGMAQPVSEGGKATFSNLTASRYFDPARDQALIKQLFGLVGKGPQAPFEGIELFLDANKNVVGEGLTHIGTLKRVKAADGNSESDEEAMYEAEFTITDVR
jgi:hypothetical protein